MSVESKLKGIATEKFAGYSWVFDDWKSADRALAKASLPAIICLMPVSGMLSFRRGRVWDSPDIILCFADKVRRDADGSDNEEVYNRMKREACRFVGEMNRSGLFEPVDGDVRYDVFTEGTANIVTGAMLSLTIKEAESFCL